MLGRASGRLLIGIGESFWDREVRSPVEAVDEKSADVGNGKVIAVAEGCVESPAVILPEIGPGDGLGGCSSFDASHHEDGCLRLKR